MRSIKNVRDEMFSCKKNIVIFGIQDFAELADVYLKNIGREPKAFTVNKEFVPDSGEYKGRPVYPFEDLEKHCPIDSYKLFAPMAPKKMNSLRSKVYKKGLEKGYDFFSYISLNATICPETKIGDNCFVLEDNTIQPFVTIGNNCVLWSGNHIGHHSLIGDNVMFTSHVVLSGHCTIGDNSFLGVNSTIRDGIKLGTGTLVAMGAMITRDTDEWGVYKGSPAKKGIKLSHEVM